MEFNGTFPSNEPKDFFEEMYSDSALKKVTIVVFFFGFILGLIAEIGIIWYERNGDHNYRTVLNQLFSTVSWITICYLLLVYFPDGLRYLIGPYPEMFCDLHLFLKNFFTCCFILLFDSIICLRFIFIFKWGKFSVFDDNLLANFLRISILVLSFWMALVKLMSVGRKPLNYFMCAGLDPEEENGPNETSKVTKKYDTTGILTFLSFALHLVISVKIFLYQRRIEKRSNNVQLGQLNNVPTSENENSRERRVAWEDRQEVPVRRSSSIPKSMADLTTQMLCFVYLVVVVIVHSVMDRTNPVELNQYQNRWLAYFNQIIALSFAILAICLQYYARNVAMRNAIWRNLIALVEIPSKAH